MKGCLYAPPNPKDESRKPRSLFLVPEQHPNVTAELLLLRPLIGMEGGGKSVMILDLCGSRCWESQLLNEFCQVVLRLTLWLNRNIACGFGKFTLPGVSGATRAHSRGQCSTGSCPANTALGFPQLLGDVPLRRCGVQTIAYWGAASQRSGSLLIGFMYLIFSRS